MQWLRRWNLVAFNLGDVLLYARLHYISAYLSQQISTMSIYGLSYQFSFHQSGPFLAEDEASPASTSRSTSSWTPKTPSSTHALRTTLPPTPFSSSNYKEVKGATPTTNVTPKQSRPFSSNPSTANFAPKPSRVFLSHPIARTTTNVGINSMLSLSVTIQREKVNVTVDRVTASSHVWLSKVASTLTSTASLQIWPDTVISTLTSTTLPQVWSDTMTSTTLPQVWSDRVDRTIALNTAVRK